MAANGQSTPVQAPILMLEKDVLAHPDLAALAQELFDTCKNEGSASRGIKHIAPNLFIGSDRRGYFHYSRHRKILLVYAYTGSDEYFPLVAAELLAHCERKGYQLNILSHRPIAAIGEVAFTATPFGVVQRILDLPSFTLEGGAMRRLRYQVGTFEKAGACSVAEYRCGSDAAVDTDIARVIDSWCSGKTKVNPLVRSAREEILAGTLHQRHRLFLTRVDGVLQNVVLISPLSDSDNGYLMDLEFYGPDMPRGGLEFAIVRIIEVLVAEGRTMLSLGGTYGCRIEQSPNADAEVDQILDDLHKQEIFNDQGNFQFKNKFRPEAKSIFLCRKAGCGNPDSIIDIIMMIADPLRMQTSDVENHTVLSAQGATAVVAKADVDIVLTADVTDAIDVVTVVAADEKKNSAELFRSDDTSLTALPQPRARLLAGAAFNPLKLNAEQVEFDLKTDSWAQLKLPAIDTRMQLLHARLQSCTDAESSLREIFPFAHFVLADSGRSAEQAFYRAWPNKGKVLQNLLFPSNLYHQIDNDFDARELPSPALFRLDSDEAGKGELDLAALDAALAKDAASVALVCIETCNNAAGGNPVSLQHLQQVKARLAPHAIPLLLDATRIVENARFQQRNDAASAAQDLWQLVREMLACADVVVVSLAKDFGLGLGGLIATNDAALQRAARAAVEQAGTGLDLFERKLIALALRDRRFIESAVDRRMQAVRTVWQALKDSGAPVLHPAGGHCVVIDVKRIPAVAGFELPVAAFLACLYLNTGIRAGAHSVGMQRRRETSQLVRLALPLGLEDEDVAQIARRLAALFRDMTNVPELLPVKDARASFGELTTEYTLKHYHQVRAAQVADAPDAQATAAVHTAPAQAAAAEQGGDGTNRDSTTMQATPDTEARSTRRTCDIAVVGMAGRYPKAKTIDELWQNLKQGLDCIEELPADRYEQRLRYGPAAKYRGGFIADVDKFDSLFFNIPPKDAERLDPQERLFAEVAWETLEDAGYYPELLNRDEGGGNVGVYVGAVWATYQTVGVEEKHLGGTQAPSSFLWSIANRVSYGMNFSGPSLTIDTACSSSLTALYLACEAIYAGECSSAIVGGVNLDLHQSKWDINWSGGALSKDGVCRSFGHGANGYVAGEGVGAVYIKPLAQAVADGDHIYGVIKGIVVNHGGRTSGFVVPNPKAQTHLIRAALARAEVDAASIGYIEAHGTGTELGDPLEIAALNNAFDGQGVATHACAVGSLKTNIGHLEAAAGVASLSKVLLQMQHRQLVPSLHSAVLNEHIDFETSPFRVQQHLQDWLPLQVDGLPQPLRAGISSFGAGGSNAHVILESHADEAATADAATDREMHIFPLSARTEAQLVDVATRLRDYLQQDAVAPLRDIAFTLQFGRKPFEFRVALLARSRAELVERVGAFLAGKKHEGVAIGNVKNADVILKLMNRSEREQVIGLLSRRRDAGKVARLWAEGVLLDWRGINGASSGRRVSLPTYPFADKRHWVPVTAAGSAVAGAARRGIHPLVDSNESTFERQLFKKTFHDGEFFIYDHRVMDVPTLPGVAYLELARKAGELAAGRPVRRLRNILWVSPIAVRDVPAEAWVELKPSHDAIQFEVFSDGDNGKKVLHSQGKILYASESELAAAAEYVDLAAIKARCAKVMDGRDAYPLFKSFGLDLGSSFQSLQEVYRSDRETLGLLQLPPARLDDLQSLMLHPSLIDGALQAGVAAQLGGASGEMLVPFSIGEVEVIHPLQPRCWSYVTEMTDERVENSRVSRKNVLILDDDGKILVRIREATGVPIVEVHKAPARKDEAGFARLFYAPEWEAAPLPALATADAPEQGDAILLFGHDDSLRELYRRQLAAAGSAQRVVLIRPAARFGRIDADTYEIDPANYDHFSQVIDSITENKYTFRHIGFTWPLGGTAQALDDASIGAALASGVRSLLPLCQALTRLKLDNKLQLVYLHASADGELPVTHDAVAGFFRALHLEFPKVQGKAVELNRHDGSDDSVLAALRAEFRADAGDAVAVRVIDGERQLRRLKLFDLAPAAADVATPHAPRERGVYLITGGAGGLGLIFAEFLARRYQARLLLTGRSAPSAEREAQFEQLRALGAEVVYIEADVSSHADVQRLVAAGKQHFGEINGVIHSAGVLRDSYVRNKTAADFDAVLAPKVFGTVYLDEATRAEPLDFFVLFSSMAAVTGNAGQSDYGYANHFMDSFAFRREQQRGAGLRTGKALSLNWSLWADGGMRVDEQTEQMFTKTLGIKLLGTDTGIDAFVDGLASSATQLAVLEGNQEKIEIAWGMRKKPQPAAVAVTTTAATPGAQQNMAALVQAELTRMAMEFLKLDAEDISPDSVLLDLGFDSIGLTTYANEINDKYGVDVTPVLFFDYPSIQEVSKYLAAERSADVARVHAAAGGGVAAKSAGTPVAAPQDSGQPQRINKGWDARAYEAPPQGGNRHAAPVNRFDDMPIAIVGMSGVMPQSDDLGEFWQHLKNGDDLISVIPEDRWDWEEFYGDPFKEVNKSNSKWGGFMREVDKFDALFFGISKREAQMMDPQQRIFLETVWKAIEDSGHRVSDLSGTRTGLFVGVATNDYVDVMNRLNIGLDGYSASGNSHSVLANRVSFLLNLRGPSAPIDTACSSSLVALHRAIESIHTGSCDMAIVGGVQVMLSPAAYISFGMAGMLSSDGKCKTFDKRANGYVRGEGSGAILLKSLAKAEADGDHIYAVVRATAENHGGRVTTLTAPNSAAQAELLIDAYDKAQMDPATVGYIECHGTGTGLGDPIEIQALTKAFSELYKRHDHAPATVPHVGLSSAKTNIGHLETAAGIAGILRVLLAIRHRQIPANVHFEEINPYINLAGTPFYIADKTRDWQSPQARDGSVLPRRAGVSSFGFGGANAHIVLEEHLASLDVVYNDTTGPQLIVLSAKTDDRLHAYAEAMLERAETDAPDLLNFAYTLQVGRDEMPERLAFVAATIDELRGKLRAFLDGNAVSGVSRGSSRARKDAPPIADAATVQALIEAQDLAALAAVWVSGAEVDWRRLPRLRTPRRMALPTYPFARERCWIPGVEGFRRSDSATPAFAAVSTPAPAAARAAAGSATAAVAVTAAPQTVYYRSVWQETPLAAIAGAGTPAAPILLFAQGEALREQLRRRLAAQGRAVPAIVLVQPGDSFQALAADAYRLQPAQRADYAALFAALQTQGLRPRHIVHAWSGSDDVFDADALRAGLDHGVASLFALSQTLADSAHTDKAAAAPVFATNLVCLIPADAGQAQPQHAALASFARSVLLEIPQLSSKCIAIAAATAAGVLDDSGVDRLIAELADVARGSTEIRYTAQQRLVRSLQPWTPSVALPAAVRERGTYVITGGAGGLGLIVAKFLASQAKVNLALIGRSALDAAQMAKLAELEALGAQVAYLRGDIAQRDAAHAVLQQVRDRFGSIHGIVHAAGVIRDAPIERKTTADFDATCAPKLYGTVHLDQASQSDDLDFFVLFSSLAAELGSSGQCDYAYANGFQHHYAALREQLVAQQQRRGRTLAIDWPLWQDGGMQVERIKGIQLDARTKAMLQESSGMYALDTDAGLVAFAAALLGGEKQLLVMHGNPARIDRLLGLAAAPAPQAETRAAAAPQDNAQFARRLKHDLLRIVAEVLLVSPQQIVGDVNLSEYGLDSLGVANLFRRLNDSYALSLAPAVVFEYPTFDALSGYLASTHAAELRPYYADAFDAAPAAATEAAAQLADLRESGIAAAPVASLVPVAIVGIAGVFPGADTPDELWQQILAGADLVSEIPADRWDWRAHHADSGAQRNTTAARWGGFLRDVDKFDAPFFGIGALEAALMDPQQRLFLQVAWNAIEDSGHRASELAGTRTGVFVGLGGFDYVELLRDAETDVVGYSATGMAHCVLPNRLSYLLDLRGPSEAIDTACSSSLVAIHRAAESIANGSCTAAIAGGTNVLLTPSLQLALGSAGMLAADGRCKTFDHRADGYVRGEGCAAVLLKRLDQAIADGDTIYAVVKGSGVNHGGRAMSLTAPNPNAQAELLVDVYRRAAVDAGQVGLIEAHGTGTAMGDAVELNGLKKAFRELGVATTARCAVGSIKTNIGHLEAASGVTSLIKTVLAMRHRTIPGVLHFEQLNPQIRLDDSPFHIAQGTQDWNACSDAGGAALPLTAGISSLGFGGVNAHLVVQEYRASQAPAADAPHAQKLARLIVLSAKTPEQLVARASDLLAYLQAGAGIAAAPLPRIAATLQVGRENLRERLAFVVDSTADLTARLQAFVAGDGVIEAAYRSRGERDSDSVGLINRDADIKAMIVSKWLSSNDLGPLLELWTQGVDIDWLALYAGALPPRINLPTYPFARERHWVDTVAAASAAVTPDSAATARSAATRRPPSTARLAGLRSAAELAAQLIGEELSRQLQIPAAQLAADRNLLELGVTSLGIASLVREVNRRLQLDLSPSLIFEHPTIARFAAYLGETSASAIGRAMATAVLPAFDDRGDVPADTAAASPRATAEPAQRRESAREVLESIVWQDSATGDEYERLTF